MSRCGCDSHVSKLLMNVLFYKYIAQPTVCEGKSVDLVRYPTTLAPLTFIPVTVTALCAENAHRASGSSLSVFCTQTGLDQLLSVSAMMNSTLSLLVIGNRCVNFSVRILV